MATLPTKTMMADLTVVMVLKPESTTDSCKATKTDHMKQAVLEDVTAAVITV